jgi:hypothetical protein
MSDVLKFTPQYVIDNLRSNDKNPYLRRVDRVRWIPPSELPFVFHTAAYPHNTIDPARCQSFDYILDGVTIPTVYVLPYPHINRVRQASEIWNAHRREGLEETGLPYTYLEIIQKGVKLGQIRLGSTMDGQYQLAALNSGSVFAVELTEKGKIGIYREVISLNTLQVIDANRFIVSSPVGLATSGLETHLPLDIYKPQLVGNVELSQYLNAMPKSSDRTPLIEAANELTSYIPQQLAHVVFGKLVEENERARKQALASNHKEHIIFKR